jgi:hypothetical protein
VEARSIRRRLLFRRRYRHGSEGQLELALGDAAWALYFDVIATSPRREKDAFDAYEQAKKISWCTTLQAKGKFETASSWLRDHQLSTRIRRQEPERTLLSQSPYRCPGPTALGLGAQTRARRGPEREVIRDLARELPLRHPLPGKEPAVVATIEVEHARAAGEAHRVGRQAENPIVTLAAREVGADLPVEPRRRREAAPGEDARRG